MSAYAPGSTVTDTGWAIGYVSAPVAGVTTYSPGSSSIWNRPSAAEVMRSTTTLSESSTTRLATYGVTHGTGSWAPGLSPVAHVGPRMTTPRMPDGGVGVSIGMPI